MLLRRRTFLTACACASAIVGRRLFERWPPRPAASLRVCSWNLRNYAGLSKARDFHPSADHSPAPHPGHDEARLRRTLVDIGADVILLQEILEPRALASLLPEYIIRSSAAGGRGGQHVAIAVRPGAVRVAGAVREFAEVTLGGRVRPALALPIQTASGAAWVVVVHLKARPVGLPQRREQWAALLKVAATLPGPLLVGGDFNCAGGLERSPAQELAEITSVFAAGSLAPLPVAGGCTAAWGGVRYDAWYEPSLLDMMWLRGWGDPGTLPQLSPGTHCATHSCAPFLSSSAYPDLDLERASDHCPIVADLSLPIPQERKKKGQEGTRFDTETALPL